ncbi:hypothetical protein, partial [Escherichia coli]|uniref:hypothetical protein n=1 Tax=Escherichia coli TaxID=562 RepID=UPI003D813B98
WSTSKTPSYTKSVSWQHHPILSLIILLPRRGFAAIPPGTGKKISLMRMKLFMAIIKIMF